MSDIFINLRSVAALLDVRPNVFKERAPSYGIPALVFMGKPMYRLQDVQNSLDRLWAIRETQSTDAQVARSVRATVLLIERLQKGSRGNAVS